MEGLADRGNWEFYSMLADIREGRNGGYKSQRGTTRKIRIKMKTAVGDGYLSVEIGQVEFTIY